jgi:hypothetical protein
MPDTAYDVLIAAIEDALPPHPDLANLKGFTEIVRESERDCIRAKLMAYAERLRGDVPQTPPSLREAFYAARDHAVATWPQFNTCGDSHACSIAAALSVVLPDETEQFGPATDYDYSRIQRQVERRAIRARFLELIDSLAVDRD